jgi:hypothetical protein
MEKETPFDTLSLGGMKTVLVKPWAFAGSARSALSSHQSVMMSLFAKKPEVSDISQQNIGDCSFLSVLAAVLATPNGVNNITSAICEIEKDNEVQGPAVVARLYDLNLKPRYIKLEKAVITAWGQSVFGTVQYHAELNPKIGCWPVFFEAAFTAFDRKGHLDPNGASYQRIQGAYAKDVFRMLLGINAMETPIQGATSLPVLQDQESQMQQTLQNLAMLLSNNLREGDTKILQEIFGNDYKESFQKWLEWHGGKRGDLWEKLDEIIQGYTGQTVTIATKTWGFDWLGTNTTINAGKVFRIKQFEQEFYVKYLGGLAVPVKGMILNYARKVFPDKRGRGQYNLYQKRLFQLMKAKHNAGDPMVLTSNSTYMGRRDKDKSGHSAGEPVVKGLVGHHAYAVLGVSEVEDGPCWIRIANPWGKTGRASHAQLKHQYNLSEEGARQQQKRLKLGNIPPGAVFEIEEAVFDLDLDDLTKRFTVLTHLT